MAVEFAQQTAELAAELSRRNQLLATAESCTGGWVSKVVTDIPGSSSWFDCGFVVYNRNAKHSLLGVPLAVIDEHGEVSEAVVRANSYWLSVKCHCQPSI